MMDDERLTDRPHPTSASVSRKNKYGILAAQAGKVRNGFCTMRDRMREIAQVAIPQTQDDRYHQEKPPDIVGSSEHQREMIGTIIAKKITTLSGNYLSLAGGFL
jgi:hypothetical protein